MNGILYCTCTGQTQFMLLRATSRTDIGFPIIINFPKSDQVVAYTYIADPNLICTLAWLQTGQAWSKCVKTNSTIHHYFYSEVRS